MAAITQRAQTIGSLTRAGAKDLVVLHVTEAVATYVSMLPPSRGLTTEAVIAIGKTFCDLPDLKHLTLSELRTFLSMALKRQGFGKTYGGFGYDTLLEWFNAYLDARLCAIIDYRDNEHLARTGQEKRRRYRTDGDAWGSTTPGEILNQKNSDEQ